MQFAFLCDTFFKWLDKEVQNAIIDFFSDWIQANFRACAQDQEIRTLIIMIRLDSSNSPRGMFWPWKRYLAQIFEKVTTLLTTQTFRAYESLDESLVSKKARLNIVEDLIGPKISGQGPVNLLREIKHSGKLCLKIF